MKCPVTGDGQRLVVRLHDGGGSIMCLSDGGESTLSRLGVLWGLAALATLLTAFVSSSWLYTREPVTLPNSDITTSVGFRIGLWRICPTVRRINSTIREYLPLVAC